LAGVVSAHEHVDRGVATVWYGEKEGRISPTASQGALSPHPEELALASVSKDVATVGASWFETALTRLLTMRVWRG